MENIYKSIEDKFSNFELEHDILRDGPLDVNRYESSEVKILWVLKQDYYDSGAHESLYSERIKSCINRNGIGSSPTWRKMSLTSYGLLTGERNFDAFPKANTCANSLLDTAVIEVNKELGAVDSQSPDSVIADGFKRYENLIHLQIEAYKPDIIITCLPDNNKMRPIVDSLYSHCYGTPFKNGTDNVYIEGADVGVSEGSAPLFLWPYHPSATKGYENKGITDASYTNSILKAYDNSKSPLPT